MCNLSKIKNGGHSVKRAILLILMTISLVSCTTLNSVEKAKIAELKSQGIKVPHEELKSPGAAGALNVLPGFGNFYLAVGTDESEHWLYGFLNLLTWPYSILWGIPEAAIDAANINKRNTVYYYTYGPGSKETAGASAAPATPVAPVPSASGSDIFPAEL